MIHGLSEMRSNLNVNIDKSKLKRGARLVVKIGTSVITNNKNAVCERMVNTLASQISILQKEGLKVVIVSSGAIAAGVHRIGWKQKPNKIGQNYGGIIVFERINGNRLNGYIYMLSSILCQKINQK